MSKSKMTKEQRAKREKGLIDAILSGLTATIEHKAKEWAMLAKELRDGLSATAIKRAERRAHKLADENPPGFVRAMECMEIFETLCKHYGISKRDQNEIWGAIAQFSMFQLGAKAGPFYDAALGFGLVLPDLGNVKVQVVRVRNPKCDCPNCRPRTAEELN